LKLEGYIDKLGYEDIRNIAKVPCPQTFIDKEIILISKRLRFSVSLEERDACSVCPFRDSCEVADKFLSLPHCTVSDLLKYLYAFYTFPTSSSIQSAINITDKLPSILEAIHTDQSTPSLKVFNIDTDYISAVKRPKKPATKKQKLPKSLIWSPSPEEVQQKQTLEDRLARKARMDEMVQKLKSMSRVVKKD
jgi:hypothetical protein